MSFEYKAMSYMSFLTMPNYGSKCLLLLDISVSNESLYLDLDARLPLLQVVSPDQLLLLILDMA